jgi:hypothetical protein
MALGFITGLIFNSISIGVEWFICRNICQRKNSFQLVDYDFLCERLLFRAAGDEVIFLFLHPRGGKTLALLAQRANLASSSSLSARLCSAHSSAKGLPPGLRFRMPQAT